MFRAWPFLVLSLLTLTAVPSSARQSQPNQPGMPTLARTVVTNNGRGEAIPVTVVSGSDTLPVAVMSAPVTTLAPGTNVAIRVTRQAWEYRAVSLRSNDDAAKVLAEAGNDGWEAVGLATTGAGSAAQVLLKRPK
jgi:hypothetical protein